MFLAAEEQVRGLEVERELSMWVAVGAAGEGAAMSGSQELIKRREETTVGSKRGRPSALDLGQVIGRHSSLGEEPRGPGRD